MSLDGVALITGAGGSGIGAATARAFAAAGCRRIVITDISSASLDKTKADLPGEVLAVPGDISSPDFVASLFVSIRDTFGRLDYAVNCAGVIGNNLPSDQSRVEDFDAVNGVNYRGLWLCVREELKLMKSQDMAEGERAQRGAIVNVASQLGIVARSDAPIYCASKSAVLGLTRADAIDASPFRIRVNAVCPGIIATPMTAPPPSAGAGPKMTLPLEIAPMKRIGRPEEVADVVVFLCSEKASFVQGASWVVDGGYIIN